MLYIIIFFPKKLKILPLIISPGSSNGNQASKSRTDPAAGLQCCVQDQLVHIRIENRQVQARRQLHHEPRQMSHFALGESADELRRLRIGRCVQNRRTSRAETKSVPSQFHLSPKASEKRQSDLNSLAFFRA